MTEIIDNLKGTAKVVCSKAKKIGNIALLKMSLRSKEVDLDECFEKLGRAYYYSVNGTAKNDAKIKALMEQAQMLSASINDLKEQIAQIQDSQVCEHCASVYKKDAEFCPYCSEHKVVASSKKSQEENDEVEENDEE